MGSKSGSKAKVTENEKALSKISMEKWDRYKRLHQGTEKAFIDEVGRDTSALLRGRAIADVAQASGTSMGDAVALGRGTSFRLGAAAENIGGARIMTALDANKKADVLRTDGRLNALKIGNDMAADAQSGLSSAARASSSMALAKARAQHTVNQSIVQGLGQLAGGAIQGHQNKKAAELAQARHEELKELGR